MIKLYQFALGTIPAEIQNVLDQNKEIFGKDYHLETQKKSEFDPKKASDIFRFELMSEEPEALFACWDLKFLSDPRDSFLLDGAPYMLAWKGDKSQGESACCYCNDCCSFFKDRLKSVINGPAGTQMKVLRNVEFHAIDPNLFYHKREGLYEIDGLRKAKLKKQGK